MEINKCFSAAEHEVIALCICTEALCDIANHAIFGIREVKAHPGEAEVRFHGHIHQELFLIRLLDFVQERAERKLVGVEGSCLEVLKQVSNSRCFDVNDGVRDLVKAVEALESWLGHVAPVKLWLPTLEIDATLQISRLEFLRISGNQSKHNLARLTRVSRRTAELLKSNGYDVSEDRLILALEDFRLHLSEDYFVYYGTWLAELTNNIRWGIQSYLMPVFTDSYKKGKGDDLCYTYEYPSSIQSKVPRAWFWRLMNNIRTGPYFPKFVGAHYLKHQCSLEWSKEQG